MLDLQAAEGPSGQLDHLQGADDSPPVVGMESRRGRRVEGGQPGMEGGVARRLGLLLQPPPQFGIGAGAPKQAAQQRLEIERCAADEQRPPVASLDRRDRRAGPLAIVGHAGRRPRLDHVDQMMRNPATLGHCRLGGADVHAPVDRHRVHRDDLGTQPARQGHADGRFARRCRACQVDRTVKWVFVHRPVHDKDGNSRLWLAPFPTV